jgi:hypothetical protein
LARIEAAVDSVADRVRRDAPFSSNLAAIERGAVSDRAYRT